MNKDRYIFEAKAIVVGAESRKWALVFADGSTAHAAEEALQAAARTRYPRFYLPDEDLEVNNVSIYKLDTERHYIHVERIKPNGRKLL